MADTDSRHTPTPWTTDDPGNDHPAIMSAKHCVATVWVNDIPRKQGIANARLIAAAPDLLAAVRGIMHVATVESRSEAEAMEMLHQLDVIREIARSALSKVSA